MDDSEGGGRSTLRVFAVAALALLGFAFSATPVAERLDGALLDLEWSTLRKFDPRPAPDDFIVVGIDDATVRAMQEPPGIWNEPLGKALALIAAAKPRAIGLDVPLPDRSFDSLRPGLDRALVAGLIAARDNGPFVAVISIDARTRSAKPIHPPYLAVLRDERLGINLLARDADGVTRRFSLVVPTDDGGFPTLAGRLCRALAKDCTDGLIHFALGPSIRYVPFHQVIENRDPKFFERLFRDRIVMIGEAQAYSDRVEVPVNLAAWEPGGKTSPAVIVHAQSLRTALQHAAPAEASRPVALILTALAALVVLMRNWRLALATALLGAAGLVVGAIFALRAGYFMPVCAALLTMILALATRVWREAWGGHHRRQRVRAQFGGRVGPALLRELLSGDGGVARRNAVQPVAFVHAGLRSLGRNAADGADEVVALLARVHEMLAAAVLRHGGMVESVRGDGIIAIFGAPKTLPEPSCAAWAAVREMFQGLERLNGERARQGKSALELAAGAAFGDAVTGHIGSARRARYIAAGDAERIAARLQELALTRGYRLLVTAAFREHLAEGEPLEPIVAPPGASPEPGDTWGWRG